MTRYTAPSIFFFSPNDFSAALYGGASRPLESVSVTSRLSGIGEFQCTYPYPVDDGSGSFRAFGVLEAIGNIVVFIYSDNRYAVGAGRVRAFGDCYVIDSAVVESQEGRGDIVRLSGRSLMSELENYPVWEPIGQATGITTTILADRPVPASSTSTINGAVSQGSDEITLANGTAFVTGDMVVIPLVGGGTAYLNVESKEEDTPNTLTLNYGVPGAVAHGATVTRYPRRLYLTNDTTAVVGTQAIIQLNVGGPFTTLVEEEPQEDMDEELAEPPEDAPDDWEPPPRKKYILVRDGIPSAANAGNEVAIVDHSTKTTTDIAAILAHAPGWTTDTNGIGTGSAHAPAGATVYELLEAVAELHNTAFKQGYHATGATPQRKLLWGFTNSGSGGKINLSNPPRSLIDATLNNDNRGIIAGRVSRSWKQNKVSRVYPTAGDAGVSLYGVSDATRDLLALSGYDIITDAATLGLYDDPYIVNAAMEPATMIARKVSFGDITAETPGINAVMNASDMLALRASDFLSWRQLAYKEWRLSNVEITSAVMLEVGQYVDVTYYVDANRQKSSYTTETLTDMVTREVTISWDDQRQIPIYDITISDLWRNPTDGGRAVASSFRNYDHMTRRVATGRELDRAVAVYTGGTSGSGDAHTHAEYLPRSGGNMTGAISLNAGVTVDGVDVSAHATNASAHHAPVTAYDTSITIPSGQAVRVNTDGARGVTAGANGVGLNISSSGGTQFNGSNQLEIKLPASSGLVRDATGLYTVAPATLTAATANSRDAGTHAITATDNANTTVAALLKGSATGALTLAALGVGATTTISATIFAQSKDQDNYTLHLKQLAGQVADVWRVEDSSGNALIRLTNGGDLESGLPGFTSGQTGWQITARGDAEFNNVRVRGELHATTFVADEMHAVGGLVLIKTAGTVSDPVGGSDNTLPALNGSFTLRVQASWDTALNYFPVGSILRIKPMGEIVSGGSLDLYDIYLQVTAVSSITGRQLGEGSPGNYALTCTLRLGGATGFVIPTGCAVVKWSEIGASGYTGAVLLNGDGGSTAPYIDVFTVNRRSSASWGGVEPTQTPRVRLGNLLGVLGKSADEWGLAAGYDLSNTNPISQRYVVASDLGVELRNVDLKAYYGANPTIDMSYTGVVKFGTDTGSDATTFFHFNSATGGLRIGPQATGKPNLYWDGTSLRLRTNADSKIVLSGSDGKAYFEGDIWLGTSGGIYQGTGSFASPTTGLKVWNSGGVGRLTTYLSGTVQVDLDTTGTLLAGAGNVVVNADGLALRPYTTAGIGAFDASSNIASIRWKTSGGVVAGHAFARYNSSNGHKAIWIGAGTNYVVATNDAGVELDAPAVFIGRSGASALTTIYGDLTQLQGQADLDFTGQTLNPQDVVASNDISAASSILAGDYVKADTGLVAGESFPLTVSHGMIASDLNGGTYRALILTDTAAINHDMTSIVSNYQYGAIGKNNNDAGGLGIFGFSENVVGLRIYGYGTGESTSAATTSAAAVVLSGRKSNGSGGDAAIGNTGNILAVDNNGTTRLVIKGNGDLYIDGTSGTFDTHDDVALLRVADLVQSGATIDRDYEAWLGYNRADLERLELVSGSFTNMTRMQRLITGAIWQLAQRVQQLEVMVRG